MPLRTLCVLAVALLFAPMVLAQSATEEARAHLQRNAFRYGLTAADLADLAVTDAYTSRRSGTTHVYLRQQANGIEIAGAEFTVAVDRNGRVFHAAGTGAADLASRALASGPSLAAEEAAAAVARDAGLALAEPFRVLSTENGRAPRVTLSEAGVAEEPVTARLVYHLGDQDRLALAWEVGLYERGAQHYWHAYVDATTGRVLARHDLVVHDSFGEAHEAGAEAAVSLAPLAETHPAMAPLALVGSYRVYPIPVETPNHSSPPAPADGRVLVTDPDDASASPYGWHDTDGAPGAEFTVTRGNNVHAYTDTDNNNSPDPGSDPDGGGGLLFDFPLDLNQQPSANRPAAVANLFYWNNVFHDVMWHYGFDEPSGNFQVNNYGNGGAGNDDVRAEAQDGGGTCNANFFTPSDGQRPRMQMYISSAFCNTNSIQRDGSLDNAVILHEYGHGVSNRLVGGPNNVSCLSNSEQMGEGWSDYFGLIFTIRPGDTGTMTRGIGTWLFGQGADGPGIRDYPYNTDFSVDPRTYAYTRTAVIPHEVGSTWTAIAWEATWELIDQFGFDPDIYNFTGTAADAGNVAMLALVTEGMKLMPCSPGFVDARDGILAADQALYGGIHIDALWAAFARRGLGIGASQGSTGTNSDNVEDFAEPEQIPPDPVTDLAAAPASLGIELTWTATGDDGNTGTAESYDIRYSTSGPITNDAEFDAATQVDDEPDPQPAGTPESFDVTGLDFATQYWFAMKVSDNSFNTSDLSNSATATTLDPPVAQIGTSPITVTTPPNTMATATFTIGNTGQSDLLYGIDFTETTPARRPVPATDARAAQPNVRGAAEVKEAPEARGVEPQFGSGGPDNFGYKWIDSDEPGGPTFDFVDIGDTGTVLSLSDDDGAFVPLPFAFPFYGVDQTQVGISSNGYLTFDTSDPTPSDLSNDPIPSASTPNAIIAMYWDDLDPGGALGDVLYEDMGDGRFIVQFDDVPHFPDGDGEVSTFQAILYESGQILLQYLSMTDDASNPNSHTIGIEDASGGIGLEVAYNEPYVEDNLAVLFETVPLFVTDVTPAMGTVPEGQSTTVTVTASADGFDAGSYLNFLAIQTNEPATYSYPVNLEVTGGAAISLDAEATTPLEVPPGGSVSFDYAVTNNTNSSFSGDLFFEAFRNDNLVRAGRIRSGTLPGGQTVSGSFTQQIPGSAPPGSYTYVLNAGRFPNTSVASASFTITVTGAGRTAARPAEGAGDDWTVTDATPWVTDGVAAVAALAGAADGVYPNPFTGQARIAFTLDADADVRLAVYDVLGREVAVLVDGRTEAGAHQAVFDARGLAAGTYLYRLTAGTEVTTGRMTLLD